MALDRSRLDLENKFLENKSGQSSNIMTNLLLLFFCYLMVSVITMCNLIKPLIRATFFTTPASDVHEG